MSIRLLMSGVVGGYLLLLAPANAAILVEPIVTSSNPNFSEGIGIPLNLQPLQLIAWNAPDNTGEQNFLNDTGLTIDSFSVLLFPTLDELEEDVVWGDVNGDGQIGLSNIFSDIKISPDFVLEGFPAPRLDLTGGEIPNGSRFSFQFITNPDLRPSEPGDNGLLVVGGVYNGSQPVPEPSTIVGSAFIFGLGSWLKKRNSAKA